MQNGSSLNPTRPKTFKYGPNQIKTLVDGIGTHVDTNINVPGVEMQQHPIDSSIQNISIQIPGGA